MKANTSLKKCSRCKQHLPLDNYSKSAKSKDGKNNYCKVCNIEYQQESRKRVYESNPSFQLLKKSCQCAFRRSKPNYAKDGYGHVTKLGYERGNIRMLPQWKNVTEGALKECQVFVIKNTRIDYWIDYSGIGEAKKATAALYRIPKNALNCVDHGTMIEADNGVGILLQSKDGQFKAGDESKYFMVMNKYEITYDIDTGVEVARTHQQVQSEVSGIEIRSSAS